MTGHPNPRGKGSRLPGPTSLEEPWRRLREAYRTLRPRWAASLARFDLSLPEYEVLELCGSFPAKAAAIARATGITPAGVTDVIDRLERRGVVRRAADPTDRRAVLVQLTPAGRTLYREAQSARREVLQGLLEAMTDRERRSLVLGLTALLRAVPKPAD